MSKDPAAQKESSPQTCLHGGDDGEICCQCMEAIIERLAREIEYHETRGEELKEAKTELEKAMGRWIGPDTPF